MDLDRHVGEWRKSGWNRFDASSTPYLSAPTQEYRRTHDEADRLRRTTAEATTHRPASAVHNTAQETVIPIVEEKLNVGTRQTERDVNVHTTVTQQPVEEQVRLREEHVTVERRAVDRPVHSGEEAAFKETTITVTETAEQPVVSRQARVVEEVVIRKEAEEHTETVRDTVRRTEVNVDQAGTVRQEGHRNFDTYDTDFRNHYGTAFARIGGVTYERYVPAYRYGYTIATDQRYRGRDWTVIEPEARRTWEEQHSGTWEQFKDAIRYAWDKVRGRA